MPVTTMRGVTVRVSTNIKREVAKKMVTEAFDRGMPRGDLLAEIIENHYKRKERKDGSKKTS